MPRFEPRDIPLLLRVELVYIQKIGDVFLGSYLAYRVVRLGQILGHVAGAIARLLEKLG